MALPELGQFYLVGGTALALYYGHRVSVDIDLFSIKDFREDKLIPTLENNFPGFTYANTHNPIGIFAFIDNIKVDFVKHHHFDLISEPVLEDGIRLMGIRDIMAMKIAAIMKRGVKKDFWDIAELLTDHTVEELIEAYNKKYPNQQLLITVPQAMTYFADAEQSEDPISLKGQTWEKVKSQIKNKINQYLK